MKQFYILVNIYITLMHGDCCKLRHISKRNDAVIDKPHESNLGFVYQYANSDDPSTLPIVTTEENKYFTQIYATHQWPQYLQYSGSSSQISFNQKRGGNRKVSTNPLNRRRVNNISVQRFPLYYPFIKNDQQPVITYNRPQFEDNATNYPSTTQNSIKPITSNYDSNERDTTTIFPVTTAEEELVTDKFKQQLYTIPVTLNSTNNNNYTTTIHPLTITAEERTNDWNFNVQNETLPVTTTRKVESVTDQYVQQNSGISILVNETNSEQNSTDNSVTKSTAENPRFNVSALIARFGLSMMQLSNHQKNLVMSPCSITTILALLQQGAAGETQQQLSNVLRMPANVTATAYKRLTTSIRERASSRKVLSVANNVFLADSFQLEEDFKRKAFENFDSEVTYIDFFDETAVDTINSWVSKATNNKINQILSSGSVNADTELVLVNTLLFKGFWESKFKVAATLSREFYINAKENKTISFMHARKNYRYGEDASNNLQVVVLPFERNEYSLMIVLPSQKSNITETLRSLSYNKLVEYNNFPIKDVDLELPKFTIRSDTNLQPLLKGMGVTKIFGTNSELSKIIEGESLGPQVSSAIHSAMLSIDEEGATASAFTVFVGIALSYESPEIVFKVNRPFLAVLWDTELALPLIMATINNPTL